jgi:hypothetical protein
MNNNDETFFITQSNLPVVFSEFFKNAFRHNPLAYVSLDEVLDLFNSEYPLNEDGEYEISEKQLMSFMNKINGLQADRLMLDMDRKGLATLAHDGNQFFLIANKS